MFKLILERERERQGEEGGEREISILLPAHPHTHSLTPICAPIRDRALNLVVLGGCSTQLRYLTRAIVKYFCKFKFSILDLYLKL